MQLSHSQKLKAKHLIESGEWAAFTEYFKEMVGRKILLTESHEQKKREELFLSTIAMKYIDEMFVEITNSIDEDIS